MQKRMNKRVFSYILLIFIFSLFMPNIKVSADKSTNKYDITINYGIDGKYRAQKYMPVNVQVNNLEKDFNGEIEIRVAGDSAGGYDAYSKEVNAKAGENINITIPVMFLESSSKGIVCLVENDKVIYEKNILISSGRVSESNIFAGVLTDDATALGYLGKISFDTSYSTAGKINTVNLSSDIIGNNSLNIDGLDLIIINNYNMANLKPEQYDALNNWVNKGGTLLIGSGANESKTINNMDKGFFNITSSGTIEATVKLINENLNLILSSLNIDNSNVIYGDNDKELVYSLEKGSGKVLITTFDIGLEPFISSNDASALLQEILLPMFNKIYEQSNNGMGWEINYAVTNLLNNIPVDNILSIFSLAAILAIYAIIIGIVLYLVLKRFKRRDLIWGLLPIFAIVFTVIIYIAGSKMRVSDVILNAANIISVDNEGKAVVDGYLGIGSKFKDDLLVEKDGSLDMNYIKTDNYYYGSEGNESMSKLRLKTTYSNNNSYYTFSDNNALEIKPFQISGKELVLPKIESDFNLNNGNLNGTVKNNLDSDIERLIVLSGNSVWDLGAVKKGQELNFEEVKLASSNGLFSYSQILSNEYYESRWNDDMDQNDDKFKNIFRHESLLKVIDNKDYIDGTSKIIAITDMPVDYNLNLENKSVSNYNTTAIIQNTDIRFKDSEGNINFPEGYFKHTVSYSDKDVSINEYDGAIYGNGEVIFDYTIDESVDIKEITLKLGSDMNGNQYGDADYYIYNYNTNEYEKFSLSSGSYNVVNDGRYSLSNIIKIKVGVQGDKGYGIAPNIGIKGVEK